MLRIASAVACLSTLALAPLPLAAQQDAQDQPDVRWVTVTTFQAPPGEDRQMAFQWMEEVMVPMARMDPNVLSYRIGTHNWGSNGQQIVAIAEYPTWEAIQADCEACNEWLQEQMPEEGTPEREAWEAMADAFTRVYLHHRDEIYMVNMDSFGKD